MIIQEHLVKLDLTTFRPTKSSTSASEHHNAIQILDLHKDHPVVLCDGVLYECEWGSTLGTDIFLSESDTLRRTAPSTWSLESTIGAGLTTSVLTARPAQVRNGRDFGPSSAGLKGDVKDSPGATQQSQRGANGQAMFLSKLAVARGNRRSAVAGPVEAEAEESQRSQGNESN